MTISDVSEFIQDYITGHAPNGTLNEYYITRQVEGIEKKLRPYWKHIRDLLDAIQKRAEQLGITSTGTEGDGHVA